MRGNQEKPVLAEMKTAGVNSIIEEAKGSSLRAS